MGEALGAPGYHPLCLHHCVIHWVFSALHFVKICLPRNKSCPKHNVKVNVLNWSDRVRIWDLLKSGVCLAEVGGLLGEMNQASYAPWGFTVFLNGRWSPGNLGPSDARVLYRYRSRQRLKYRHKHRMCVGIIQPYPSLQSLEILDHPRNSISSSQKWGW
jgi:hypothetical protein